MAPADFVQRLRAGNVRQLWFAAFVLGALMMLSFAPVGAWGVAPLLLVPLFFAFLHLPPRTAAGVGFWFGAGLFLTGTYWLYISIHVFGQAPLALAIFLMLALVIIMGLYYAGAGWLTARLGAGNAWRGLAVAPAVWVALEWLRGWFLTGFPWMTLGYGQIDSPLIGYAPVIGVYGLSLIVALTSSAVLIAVVERGRLRTVPFAVMAALWLVGPWLGKIDWTDDAGPAVTTTIVQGSVSQDRKWLPEQFQPTLKLYRDALLAHPDSSLVVWPEVAVPSVLDRVESYVELLQRDLRATGQSLAFGILERDLAAEKIYNSVVLLDGQRRQVYRKRHLVPFGEYFPVPDFVREWMRLLSLPHSDISSGDAVQPLLEMPDGQRLAVAICYEDAYAAEQLYALPEATILINVSNDAWFGDSIAPHQHLEIARMRAVEVGRPVVRATNTGISVFIGADGALTGTAPQFEVASISAGVVPKRGLTPYARFGNCPIIGLVLLAAALAGTRIRQGNQSSD